MAAALNRARGFFVGLIGLALSLAGGWGRAAESAADPTRPPERLLLRPPAESGGGNGGPVPQATPIVLQAILLSEGRPSRVMIDGWLYRAGDVVQGRRLLSISPQAAEFETAGRPLRIALTPAASLSRVRLAESSPQATPSAMTATATRPVRLKPRTPTKDTP